jgi:CRP-like cAMP-binding protein
MTTGEKTGTSREKLLIQVLRKIPIFNGLSPSQVKRILSLCTNKLFEPGQLICRSNTLSDEMFILLSGEVAIVTSEGMKVATILPVTTVGEMGVVTGQPRSATVEVIRPTAIFSIQKVQFDLMLKEDTDMRDRVHKAIIDILSSKLSNDNVRIRDYHMEKDRIRRPNFDVGAPAGAARKAHRNCRRNRSTVRRPGP